jgi:hypothetical protein
MGTPDSAGLFLAPPAAIDEASLIARLDANGTNRDRARPV